MTFTNRDKLEAVERELKNRARVYPRLVEQGKMSQRFADLQIAIMTEIGADYRKKVEGEDLFGGARDAEAP